MDTKVKGQLSDKMASVMKNVVALKNQNDELVKQHEKAMDEVFCEFIKVIDTFERSEQIIKEKKYDQVDEADKSIKRLLNAKKKALAVLEAYNVRPIDFENNKMVDELCTTVGTEPDSTKENGDIISIEKAGYTRCGRVIRHAEVVIVKN